MVRQYLLFLITLCAAASVSFAGVTGILAGKVTDQEGNPVAGATVRVVGTTRGAMTNLDGKYTVININAGSYDVRVTAVGFDTVTKRVSIVADQTLTMNVSLSSGGGVQMKVIDVSAEREMVRSTDIGTTRVTKGEDLTKVGRDNIASALSLSAGIRASGNNFIVRGGRTNETQVLVDGLTMTDQFTGGLGNVGSTISAVMPSPFATVEVQAQTGGFGAEYGNAVAGIVNTVVKTGRTDRYEGLIRLRKDVPFLFGKAGNGIQAGAPHEDVVDVTLGGPVGLGRSTFFVAVRNTFQNYRNFGLEVIDPIGNNWGMLPNNRTWSRNITPRLRMQIDDNSALVLGGSYGMTVGELSSTAWLYANEQGYKTDLLGNPVLDANNMPIGNGVPERVAKQPIVQEYNSNAFAQLNQTLGSNTFFDVRASITIKTSDIGKPKSFSGPGLFNGVELFEPADNLSVDDIRYIENQSNTILDEYEYMRQNSFTNDGYNPIERTKRNPLTGYYEGTSDAQSTNNPFGLLGYFYNHGNTTSRELRQSNLFQVDGNVTHNLEVGDTRHVIKSGFEFRTFDLSLYSNGAPWSGDQYAQSYGRPNVTNPDRTRDARKPVTAALFVQDQIMLKGLVLTPGLRMDYLNANASTFDVGNPDSLTPDATTKLVFAPRISVVYPITQRQNFQLSYGIYYQNPAWSNFFDGVYSDPVFQDFFGNPNLQPQRTNQFQVAYNHQLNDELALSITGYYNDIQNQPSIRIDTFQGRPKYQYDLASYGTSRGIEMSFMKRMTDNWSFNINYTIAGVRGNANSATQLPPVDPITGDLQFPIVDFPLGNDLPHRINAVVGFAWGRDEGPTIAGYPILEYLTVNLSGFWQSGLPYTPVNIRGQIAGQINSARFPSNWFSEMRLTRTIPLTGIFGGRTALDLSLDVENLLNYTGAISFYTTTRSPDYDGFSLNRRPSDFPSATYYRDADPANKSSISLNQYDRYGNRFYQERVDFNKDGRVTPEETFRGYQDYVNMIVNRRGNYQFPRRVYFAVAFRF